MLIAIAIAEKIVGLPLIALGVIFDMDASEAKFAKPTKYNLTPSTFEYLLQLSRLFPFSP